MKLFWKIFGLAAGLAMVFLLSFFIWGEELETLFSHERCTAWFNSIRPWAWLIAIGLLVSDLVLPVPATGVMTALGAVYGPWLGALIGAAGSFLAGLSGYFLARAGGKRVIRRLADPEELRQFHAFFDRWGGIAIIGSRIMPILPEVLTLLAGLARMQLGRFMLSLGLGSAGASLLFAYIGGYAREEPRVGIFLSLALPMIIYLLTLHFFLSRRSD